MCRILAYLGKKPIAIGDLLDKPENSLLNQSRKVHAGTMELNADGVGISWYEHSIDNIPGIYKSTRPAWNDNNLQHIANKVKSTCFLGHIRASSVGDVNLHNCHPFRAEQYSFVHNGNIDGFTNFKRKLVNKLTDKTYDLLKGQTDSEHYFLLLLDKLFKGTLGDLSLAKTCKQIPNIIKQIQKMRQKNDVTKLNTVLTDGKQLLATRYISDSSAKPLSLYYSLGDHVAVHDAKSGLMLSKSGKHDSIIIASEALTDYSKAWTEVPLNHMLTVDENLHIKISAID